MSRFHSSIVALLLALAILGCDGQILTAPHGFDGMPVTDLTRNPIASHSDFFRGSYDSMTGVCTITLPWPFRDTVSANELVISYSDMLETDYEIWNVHDRTWQVFARSPIYDYWQYQRAAALISLSESPPNAFIDNRGRVLIRSSLDPNASISLVRYRPSYSPRILNRKGSGSHPYFDDIDLAADTDGIWVAWCHETKLAPTGVVDFDDCTDTIVKFNAWGERVTYQLMPAGIMEDFLIRDGVTWVLTRTTPRQVVSFVAGVETGRFSLDSSVLCAGILLIEGEIWANCVEWDYNNLLRIDLAASMAARTWHTLDTIRIESTTIDPTWDGEAVVYWGWRRDIGGAIIRQDRYGRVLAIVRPQLSIRNELCWAIGSYWTAHHGSAWAPTHGTLLSRVTF